MVGQGGRGGRRIRGGVSAVGPAESIAGDSVGEAVAITSDASTTNESVGEVSRVYEGAVGDVDGGNVSGVDGRRNVSTVQIVNRNESENVVRTVYLASRNEDITSSPFGHATTSSLFSMVVPRSNPAQPLVVGATIWMMRSWPRVSGVATLQRVCVSLS